MACHRPHGHLVGNRLTLRRSTTNSGALQASGLDGGQQYWTIEVPTFEDDPALRGKDMDVFIGVRIDGILHYKSFKVSVAP